MELKQIQEVLMVLLSVLSLVTENLVMVISSLMINTMELNFTLLMRIFFAGKLAIVLRGNIATELSFHRLMTTAMLAILLRGLIMETPINTRTRVPPRTLSLTSYISIGTKT